MTSTADAVGKNQGHRSNGLAVRVFTDRHTHTEAGGNKVYDTGRSTSSCFIMSHVGV